MQPVEFWDPGVAARIQGKFGGWWNSITERLSRQFFSWSFFRAHIQETWGFCTVFIFISLKTEIARSVEGPTLQGPHAEDAMAKAVLRAANFGDLITADHKVLSDNCESRNNHRYAVVVQDLATQWIQAYPCKNKTSQETQRSLQKFLEPERKPKVIYTVNFLGIWQSLWRSLLESLHVHTTQIRNKWDCWESSAQSKGRHLCCMFQSGLNESWWTHSMECYTCLRNVTDLLSDGKTPYERRFGQPFKGLIIPCGSLVEYHPITAKDQWRTHQFGKKVLPGLFLGYALSAGEFGRVTNWSQTLRSWKRWTHRKSTRKDSMRKRWYFPNKEFFFQSQMDESKPLEEIRTWEHQLWYGIDQFKETVTLFSWRIRRVSSTTSRPVSGCQWSDKRFLAHVGKLHIPPSRWTSSQTLLAERGIFPYSTEIHWRNQNNTHEFGCQARSALMIVGILMALETCLNLGQVSLNLLYSTKKLLTDICGPGGD